MRLKAHTDHRTNAPLIAEVFQLYTNLAPYKRKGKPEKRDARRIEPEDYVFDWTFGLGSFWTKFRPANLGTNDLFSGGAQYAIDYTSVTPGDVALMLPTRPVVSVFDGPYGYRGTPKEQERYGLDRAMTVQERNDMLRKGMWHIANVTENLLMVKAQDQAVSDQFYQQHDLMAEVLPPEWVLDTVWTMRSGRPQPEKLGETKRTQRRPDNNISELRVYWRRGKPWPRKFWTPPDMGNELDLTAGEGS